jgi:hypothetical protein
MTTEEYESVIEDLLKQVEQAVIIAFRNNGMIVRCVEEELDSCLTCPLMPCAFRKMLDNAEKSTGKNLLHPIKKVMAEWKHRNGGYCSPYESCNMYNRAKDNERTIEFIHSCATNQSAGWKTETEKENIDRIAKITEDAISRFKRYEQDLHV